MNKFIENTSKYFVVAFSVAALTVSCSTDLDINDNPNYPTTSTPELTLAVAEQDMLDLRFKKANYVGNQLTGVFATPSDFSANEEFIRYLIPRTNYYSFFNDAYRKVLKNLKYVNDFKDDKGNDYSAYHAVAKILRADQFQMLVDVYGDVPFSEANLRDKNLTPKYDDSKTIYKSLIDDLTLAAKMALASEANTAAKKIPAIQDFICKGDMKLWARVANTIKMRLLVRLGNTEKPYITAEFAKITANGQGFITTDVLANPGYTDAEDKQSSLWEFFGKQPGGKADVDRGTYTCASEFILNNLSVKNDERYNRLFAESRAGGYKGAPVSSTLPGNGFTKKDLSHLGPGILKKSDQDVIYIKHSEALFLEAEANLEGYISTNSAKALYEQAVKSSFVHLGGVDANGDDLDVISLETIADTYLAQAGVVNVNWDASVGKLEAIITQKFISNIGSNGVESWIEMTRTGFPSNVPHPLESGQVRPVRLLYPATEVSRNSVNVPAQSLNDAFSKAPFWKH